MFNVIVKYYLGVQCTPCEEPPFYICGSCPLGFTGNGTNCVDLDEVRDPIIFYKINKHEIVIFMSYICFLSS